METGYVFLFFLLYYFQICFVCEFDSHLAAFMSGTLIISKPDKIIVRYNYGSLNYLR